MQHDESGHGPRDWRRPFIDYTGNDSGTEKRYDVISTSAGTLVPSLRRALTQTGGSSSSEARPTDAGSVDSTAAPGDTVVPGRGPETRHVRLVGGLRGPDRPRRAHPVRQGDTSRRQDLPPERCSVGHQLHERWTCSRKGRHHRVRRTRKVYSPKLVEEKFSVVRPSGADPPATSVLACPTEG